MKIIQVLFAMALEMDGNIPLLKYFYFYFKT